MQLLRTLVDCDKESAEPALPRELRELYDGDLHFRAPPAARPLVIANFVSTLDGVASYKIEGESGGSTISGSTLRTNSSWACCGLPLTLSWSGLERCMT